MVKEPLAVGVAVLVVTISGSRFCPLRLPPNVTSSAADPEVPLRATVPDPMLPSAVFKADCIVAAVASKDRADVW